MAQNFEQLYEETNAELLKVKEELAKLRRLLEERSKQKPKLVTTKE